MEDEKETQSDHENDEMRGALIEQIADALIEENLEALKELAK